MLRRKDKALMLITSWFSYIIKYIRDNSYFNYM